MTKKERADAILAALEAEYPDADCTLDERVSYLLAGENMGPEKLKKAEKLGVKIITEQEYQEMLKGQSPA